MRGYSQNIYIYICRVILQRNINIWLSSIDTEARRTRRCIRQEIKTERRFMRLWFKANIECWMFWLCTGFFLYISWGGCSNFTPAFIKEIGKNNVNLRTNLCTWLPLRLASQTFALLEVRWNDHLLKHNKISSGRKRSGTQMHCLILVGW